MAGLGAGPLEASGISERCREALVWGVLPGVSPRGFLSSRGESTEERESQRGAEHETALAQPSFGKSKALIY